ncbi:MAG: class I SAM-dependent methyltransferase, partial [Nitrospinota bacterium]|nr:class I SAM-dependent methyltransferase [Nitrospinota bacterium]
MNGWEDFQRYRDKFSSLQWWDREKLIFYHDFKPPFTGTNALMVIPRGEKVLFPLEKIKRILGLVKNMTFSLVIEETSGCEDLLKLEGEHPDNNTVKPLIAKSLLSESIRSNVVSGTLPTSFDYTILFAPYFNFDNSNFIGHIPLAAYLRTLSKNVYSLDNRNRLTLHPDSLDDFRDIDGKRIFGFASLTNEDMELIYKYAGEMAGGVFVEIGRYLGGSTNLIATAIKGSGKNTKFHSFDPILPDVVLETLKKNCVEDYVTLHKTDSSEAFKNWESISGGKGVDFLFIDGDHSYEGVTFDLTSWGSIVKKGGVIIA